jgi:hypothetical protein
MAQDYPEYLNKLSLTIPHRHNGKHIKTEATELAFI